jgi:hypothetical protein
VIAAILLAAVAFAAPAAPHSKDDTRFATAVEQAKAHLVVCRELYTAGKAGEAALHASHPVHEIGGRILGPARRADAALGERVQAALKRARLDVDAKVAPAKLERGIDETFELLDRAVTQVVTDPVTRSFAFKVSVLREMLAGIGKEYDEAYKNGKITQLVEYQDAYGFFVRSRVLYQGLVFELRQVSPGATTEADVRFATLGRAFPGLTPPANPVSMVSLKETLASITSAIGVTPPSR